MYLNPIVAQSRPFIAAPVPVLTYPDPTLSITSYLTAPVSRAS